ncbi:MAG: glycosyltransferase family 2 protein [Syntrophaceae bacterium]|nr:glycosyltransferase family 2 protein [Syntrophaceae bacterium]
METLSKCVSEEGDYITGISNPNPLVTALICNYNYGRYLGDAIESALAQTWKNLEVIVVDDGSTDESREVLKNYEGKIKTILKENGGQASAFNEGIAEARGEIICFLDSDDFWYPERVELTVAKYQEAPWGLVCNELLEVNEAGVKIGDQPYSLANHFFLQSGDVLKFILDNGFSWVFSPTSGLNLTMEIAKKIFPLPEKEWRICADSPIAYGAICHAPVGVISKPLGAYRLHGANSFASMRSDKIASDVGKLIKRTDSYLFFENYLSHIGKNKLKEGLKSIYPYYRLCCFITRNHPWRYLLKLWKRNIQYHFMNRKIIHLPLLNAVRYLLLDALLCLLMFMHLPTPYQTLYERYRKESLYLNTSTCSYLEND